VLGIVAVTYAIAVVLMIEGDTHVFDLGVWCFSGFAALFPLVFAAVYWKRATRAGAIACLLTTAIVWFVFFYRDIFLEKPAGSEDEALVMGMMPVTFIFAASAAALVIVSLITPRLPDRIVNKFFAPELHNA
jgi:SSS family solute:Na+ symporter